MIRTHLDHDQLHSRCRGTGRLDKRPLWEDECSCVVEMIFDGTSFWANQFTTGINLARFSPYGISIHRLDCYHALHKRYPDAYRVEPLYNGDGAVFGSRVAWERFVQLLKRHHHVEVPDKFVTPNAFKD